MVPLTPRELALRLLARNVIAPRTLFHGDLTFSDASHRNHGLMISRRGRPFLFVKQPGEAASVEYEAEVYGILRRRAALSRLVPAVRHHEPGLLVLGAIRGETLAARAARTRRAATSLTARLGRAVALLHESNVSLPAPPAAPWILSLGAPPIEILRRASGANLEILRIVQGSSAICRGLAALRAEWSGATPLHNDLRLENCLVETNRGGSRIKLVDWELAAPGDPAWEVGSFLASMAALWLFSMRGVPGMTADQVARTASIPLPRIGPGSRAFWRAYAAARRLAPRARRELGTRSIRFAAARLLQLSWERMAGARLLSAEVICTIQAAANMLDDPAAAAPLLLGNGMRRSLDG
jgi:hypothetical protein